VDQLPPLLGVAASERLRVSALAGTLDLEIADRGASHVNRVVRPGVQVHEPNLAVEYGLQAKRRGDLPDQSLGRTTQLILRATWPLQLRPDLGPELGYSIGDDRVESTRTRHTPT